MIKHLIYSTLISIFPVFLHAQTHFYDWAFSYKGYGTASGLLTDPEGSIYVLSSYGGPIDGDPGTGEQLFDSGNSNGLFIQKLSSEGSLQWIKTFDGSGSITGNSMVQDTAGNIYIAGTFQGTIDFDPENTNNDLTASGNSDGFLLKLDSDGNLFWVKKTTGTGVTNIYDIALDNDQNPVLLGIFSQTTDFDFGPSNAPLTATGMRDIFIQKLDTAANPIWIKQLYGTNPDDVSAIAINEEGFIYITGAYQESKDFDPGNGSTVLDPEGGLDIYLLKLTETGDFVWVKSIGGEESEYASELLIDQSGNLLISGAFASTMDFDPDAGTSVLTNTGHSDGFILRMNGDGQLQWVKQFGIVEWSVINDIAINREGQVYVTGNFSNFIDLDPGDAVLTVIGEGLMTGFTVLLDTNGNYKWSETTGTSTNEICTDAVNTMVLAGVFIGTSDFNPNGATANLTSTGEYGNLFLQKLSNKTLGISALSDMELMISPNPATTTLMIKRSANDHCTITGFGADGKIVFRQVADEKEISVNIEGLNSGAYTIEIRSDEQMIQRKFVKL